MPPPLTNTQVMIIETLLLGKHSQAYVAKMAGCNIRTVKRIAQNLKYFETPRAPAFSKRGWPPLVTEAMRQVYCFFMIFVLKIHEVNTAVGTQGVRCRKSLGIPG
jgi:hypothetical protein